MAALVSHLSPERREVLLLRVVADLSVEEIAAVLGKSYEAVKTLQRVPAAYDTLQSVRAWRTAV